MYHSQEMKVTSQGYTQCIIRGTRTNQVTWHTMHQSGSMATGIIKSHDICTILSAMATVKHNQITWCTNWSPWQQLQSGHITWCTHQCKATVVTRQHGVSTVTPVKHLFSVQFGNILCTCQWWPCSTDYTVLHQMVLCHRQISPASQIF